VDLFTFKINIDIHFKLNSEPNKNLAGH